MHKLLLSTLGAVESLRKNRGQDQAPWGIRVNNHGRVHTHPNHAHKLPHTRPLFRPTNTHAASTPATTVTRHLYTQSPGPITTINLYN